MYNTDWTAEEDALLVKCINEGLSARKTAEVIFNRNKNMVIGRAARLGIRFHSGKNGNPPKVRIRTLRGGNMKTPAKYETHPCIDLAEPPPATAVAIWELNMHHCRWSCGDPSDHETHRYCGAWKEAEASYCKVHAKIVYLPRPPQTKKRAAGSPPATRSDFYSQS